MVMTKMVPPPLLLLPRSHLYLPPPCTGVRDASASKYKHLSRDQPRATLASVADACAWCQVAILAIPGSPEDAAIAAAAKSLGPGIKGKVLIDATNPLGPYPELEVRWVQGTSCGEVLAAALPDAHVYKAFNTIGAEHMAAADGSRITGQRLTMLIAGAEDQASRRVVEAVVEGVGFLPEWVGPIRYARNLEAIAELWIHLGLPSAGLTKVVWGRDFHFQVIKKPGA